MCTAGGAYRVTYAQPGECLVTNQAPSFTLSVGRIAWTVIYCNDKYLEEESYNL